MAKMPDRVFVDTSAWYAVMYNSDRQYKAATEHYRRLVSSRAQLLTTDYILDETITRLRYDAGHSTAMRFWRKTQQAEGLGLLTINRVTEDAWNRAMGVFEKYDDQAFSFTDCTSFVVAQESGVDEVFAFDEDFRLFGLVVNPVP